LTKYRDDGKLNKLSLSFAFLCFLVISCSSVTNSFSIYLSKAQLTTPTPHGDSFFNDEFNNTILNNKWTVIDPTGNSTFSQSANIGYLRITSPPNTDLWQISKNYNAPRIEQTGISGDFVAETRILALPNEKYECEGIYIWKDGDNFLRFERYYADLERMHLTMVRSGKVFQTFLYNTELNPTYLKINRAGDLFTGFYSADGTNWVNFANYTFPVSGAISVGLDVVNFGPPSNFFADFDYFRISGGNPQPTIAPSATLALSPSPPRNTPINIPTPSAIITTSSPSISSTNLSPTFSLTSSPTLPPISQSINYGLMSVIVLGLIFLTSIAVVNRTRNKRKREKQSSRAQQAEREKAERERQRQKEQAERVQQENERKERERQKSQRQPAQSNTSSNDPFEVLGLPRNATKAEVREAFLRLSKEWHPDKFAKHGDPKVMQMAHENYIKIKNAYEQINKTFRQ
jgi:regulation of enolase protein 1 (concanavalin A-like superfamily)